MALCFSPDPDSRPTGKLLSSLVLVFHSSQVHDVSRTRCIHPIPYEVCLILLSRARYFITITIMPRRNPRHRNSGRNKNQNNRGTHSNKPQCKNVHGFPGRRNHQGNALENNHMSNRGLPTSDTPYSNLLDSRHHNVQKSSLCTCLTRDLGHERYHRTIRSIFDEGSALEIRLGNFLDNLTRLLQPQADEMDWESSNQTYIVTGRPDVPAIQQISWGSAGARISNISQELEKSRPGNELQVKAIAAVE